MANKKRVLEYITTFYNSNGFEVSELDLRHNLGIRKDDLNLMIGRLCEDGSLEVDHNGNWRLPNNRKKLHQTINNAFNMVRA